MLNICLKAQVRVHGWKCGKSRGYSGSAGKGLHPWTFFNGFGSRKPLSTMFIRLVYFGKSKRNKHISACISIYQHISAYISIYQHMSAYVSICHYSTTRFHPLSLESLLVDCPELQKQLWCCHLIVCLTHWCNREQKDFHPRKGDLGMKHPM
jgi:hypothetical protein